MFKRESGLVLYDDEIISVSQGSAISVEFDFLKIWEIKKKNIYVYFYPEKLRFYHVHPPNFLEFSQTDYNCMDGFKLAFNCNIYFSIITFNEEGMYDLGYKQKSNKIDIPLDNKYLLLLKTLSYMNIFKG